MRFFKLILLIFIFSCSKEKMEDLKENNVQEYPAGGPYYYSRWKTYQIPYQPVERITLEEVKKRKSYYEAYFNNNGKIIKFTKYLNDKKEFVADYTYRKNGVVESGNIDLQDGRIVLQQFDGNGKMISNKYETLNVNSDSTLNTH